MLTVTYSGMLRRQLSPEALRARIFDLERVMLAADMHADCPVRNLFSPGQYRREVTIPAGVLLIGAEHKTRHLNILSRGRIVVWTETGMRELVAPFEFWSEPGTKRAGYAIEESVWTTVHENPDNETDLEVLCKQLTTAQFADLMENRNRIEVSKERPCLGES